MASTTNKNTPGNYSAEQRVNAHIGQYLTYKHSSGAKAYTNHHPGFGVLPAKTARSALCTNYCDVESQLFGIGSTNLVAPKPEVNPEYKTPQSLNFVDGVRVQLPDPVVIQKDQRPYMNF
jgi:hypothetical protein|tara:strand:+ start:213 stop:572 length:360 start_codon:yes stop_codon:yes gene_type:complete